MLPTSLSSSRSYFPITSQLSYRLRLSSLSSTSHSLSPNVRHLACTTLDLLLQRCATPREAKQLHAHLLLSSSRVSAFLSSHLISAYARLGQLSDAVAVFLASADHHRDSSLLWNSILRAHLAHGREKDTILLYSQMRAVFSLPDCFTFPLVLRACAALGVFKLCASVHGHAVSMGLQCHLHVGNELVLMYGQFGRMGIARKMFDAMPVKNVMSWNTLLSGYSMNCDSEAANEVFRRMEDAGTEANPVTWTTLLSVHARCRRHEEVVDLFCEMRARGGKGTAEAMAVVLSVCPYIGGAALDKGREVHGYGVRCGFEQYPFVRNSLICMYGKLGNREEAERLFTQAKVKDLVCWNALISAYAAAGLCDKAYEIFALMEEAKEVSPNVVSWSAVIGAFASNEMIEGALELFRRMQQSRLSPNSVTVATVLSACAELSALKLGREIHGHTIRGAMDRNLLVANGLLNMYAKSGSLRDGRLVFDQIDDQDLISWNSMIAGYGMHGLCDEALATFDDMVRVGYEPDEVTFIAMVSACSHAGRVADGRQLFDQMIEKYKISPSMEHYACMVDLLGRAGLLREAAELIEKMPVKPNLCVLGALLNSCRIHGNAAFAEDTAARVLGMEGESTGSYMLLSNTYAACGRWEDSARVRVMTKVRSLKKNPGQSWIEVRNKVHVFSAGSILPPGAEGIYVVLEDLYLQMEAENYAIEELHCDCV
ncbi:putative pentatricopeptide repeat-containing protein At1g17630 [Typha latifolia]|uniref:putative pentatricopeptide repeat-containing protein At1g17630 n=1 Tax=Typha latifolia TaxID=4733 RepID=UPI003C301434